MAAIPQIHGHRGSRGTHPENTLPAFSEAVKAGAHVLELDLQLSKDGIPVLSHDPYLGPLCTDATGKPLEKPIPIRRLTVREIQTYECGRRGNPKFPEQAKMTGVRIPTLDELLAWTQKHAPKLELNIETKMTAPDATLIADPTEFAGSVFSVLKKHGALSRTILQSFDFRTLHSMHRLAPEVRLSCLFEKEEDFCRRTREEKAQIASPNLKLVTKAEVKRCHDVGIQVVPWTANTNEEWASLREMGVDAIITDFPRRLADFFHARN